MDNSGDCLVRLILLVIFVALAMAIMMSVMVGIIAQDVSVADQMFVALGGVFNVVYSLSYLIDQIVPNWKSPTRHQMLGVAIVFLPMYAYLLVRILIGAYHAPLYVVMIPALILLFCAIHIAQTGKSDG